MFTETLYSTAATSEHGMVTGEPAEPVRTSWYEVHLQARKMAGALATAGIGYGDAVTVLAGAPIDIAPAIQAAWMRGASITMLHQPTPRTDLAVWAQETLTTLNVVSASTVVVGEPFDAVRPVLTENGIGFLEMADLKQGDDIDPLEVGEDATALLQLTSGSTGHPKAVRITHQNLAANIDGMMQAGDIQPETDVAVSWLPLFHDMGMVGFLTLPMQQGAELVTVTPTDFLSSPMLWMKLIHKYGGSLTAAPNFAYSVIAKRLARWDPETDGELDLSTLRFALNGAEPIDPSAVRAFAEAAGRFGFKPGSFVGAYGMAEVTLAVSFTEPGVGILIDAIDALALERDRKAVPTVENADHPGDIRHFPILGPPVPGISARVVDSEGTVLGARGVGVLQLKGVAATPGYLTVDGPVATQDVEGWLDTGDEGYLLEDGHIVVCGRVKDVIIMGGRNIYPTDIERAAGEVAGVRAGNVVAVRLDASDRRESFGVALESNKADNADETDRISKEVAAAVVAAVGVRPRTVTVLPAGSLPKTPSGKLRRSHSVGLITQ